MSRRLELIVPDEFIDELLLGCARLSVASTPDIREGWLNADNAAEYLDCSRKRIYDLIGQGRLQYAKEGKRLLFRREWLDDTLEHETHT